MSTHEVYCSLDICKLLKEAGFDWECCYCYDAETKDFLDDNEGEFNFNECDDNDFYSAPTLDVAQRWLREIKKFNIYVQKQSTADHHYFREYYFQINESPSNLIPYETYEEAQEAGIKKALEIILMKGK